MDTRHTPYLYGMTDLCPDNVLDGKGVIVHPVRLGHNPDDFSSVDYSDRRETMICRPQHGWGNEGTLPIEPYMPYYLQRMRNFVSGSKGVNIWIAWNEPNHSQERPNGQIISPSYAATSYLDIRDVIRSLPGHDDDLVLVGAIAPWNIETGDWLEYMQAVYAQLPTAYVDGIALHAYTHGAHPDLIFSMEVQHGWLWHFRTYQQQINVGIPDRFKDRPIYITETNQGDGPWLDYNNGWAQNAYLEIDDWNRAGEPTIRSLVLYRWAFDQWKIQDKDGVKADLHTAMEHEYTWTGWTPPDPPEDNMLENHSFEGGWYNQTPDGILVLPEGWFAEYQEGDDPYKRPEIKPNQEFVTDGTHSIRSFPPEHSRAFSGICQDVDVEPGQWYRLSADVRIESKPSGELTAFVGIQPWGGSIFERQMIWGKETRLLDEFQQIEAYVQAFGGRIRVALGSTNKWASKNNTTWWDNAKLEPWECDGGTEPPVDPPEPGECSALTYAETVAAVEQGVKGALEGLCIRLE